MTNEERQNALIAEAARIIGCSPKRIMRMEKYLPFIAEELDEVFRNNKAETDEEKEQLVGEIYDILHHYHILYVFDEVAEIAEIQPKIADLFSDSAKERVVNAYITSDNFREVIGMELSEIAKTADLPNVAKLMDMPLAELKKLSHETQVELCDCFFKRYNPESDNFTLKVELGGMVTA